MGAPTDSSSPTASPDATKRPLGLWIAFAACCVIALGSLGYLVTQFADGRTFFVPSQAMEPTIHVGDRIEVRGGTTHRGDIVVFATPPGQENSSVKYLVKRVVALPGERVEGKAGVVLVNGQKLDEPYVNAQCGDALGGGPFAARTIPAGHVWVLGDNRCNSSDSRIFGPIATHTIVGRMTTTNVVPRFVTALVPLGVGIAGAIITMVLIRRRAS